MIAPEALRLEKFGGLNTQSPYGITGQPSQLHNVYLGHPGGYGALPALVSLQTGVNEAVYSGKTQGFFLRKGSVLGRFEGNVFTAFPYSLASLFGAVFLAPDMVYVPGAAVGDDVLATPQAALPVFGQTTIAFWDGTGTQPTTPHWYYEGVVSGGGVRYTPTSTQVEIAVQIVRFRSSYIYRTQNTWPTPTTLDKRYQACNQTGGQTIQAGPFTGSTTFPPPTSAKYPVGTTAYRVVFSSLARIPSEQAVVLQLWRRERLNFLFNQAYKWTALKTSIQLDFSSSMGIFATGVASGPFALNEITVPIDPDLAPRLQNVSYKELAAPRVRVATYHNSRIWVAANGFYTAIFPEDDQESAVELSKDVQITTNTLWYSGVYYGLGNDEHGYLALPDWSTSFFLNVPFRVSSRIEGLLSLGRYLYIFGNLEVAVLVGNSDADFNLEMLGDSNGLLTPQSLQRLGQSIFYLSDSGVMRLRGSEAQEISAEVRDLALSLNRATLSSSVDFERELYLIGDGTTLLVYHAREEAWTTRDPVAKLIYGGGRSVSLSGTTLSSLSDAGPLLPAEITWGPLEQGDFWSRKSYHGVACGLDCDGPVTATLTTQTEGVGTPIPLARTAGKHSLRYALQRTSGNALTLTLKLEADASVRRMVLRPPLSVKIDDPREAQS